MPFIIAAIFLLIFGSLLVWAVHEGVIYYLLQRGGAETIGYVSGLRISRSSKSSTHYIKFHYHTPIQKNLSKEQSVSAGLYRHVQRGENQLQIRYLPGKPEVCRVWEKRQLQSITASNAILAVVFGFLLIGPFRFMIEEVSGALFPGLSLITIPAVLVLAALGFYAHYAQFADLGTGAATGKAKLPPTEESYQSPALEDDPFAIEPPIQKAKNEPTKAKRTTGFTPLDDDHPLI